MEDKKIIELIRSQKHDKVFTKLYSYFPVVKKMIVANGGKPEDAEDIYQEALIIFYKKAGQENFQLTSSINTYLYSICRFMWLKLKKQNQPFVDFEKQQVAETEFIEDVASEEGYKLAEQVISQLGERCKELLILFYFRFKKMKDIAVEMGYTSENTAKNQKYKCLETAKIRLKELKEQS